MKPEEQPCTTAAHTYAWNQDNYYQRPHVRLRAIASLIKSLSDGRKAPSVLDIGCGQATLATLLGQSFLYLGCDGYKGAPRRQTPTARCVEWVYSDDAPALPVEQKTFDVVVCSGFAEYVNRRSEFLQLVSRHLHHDGVFLISFINFFRWDRVLARGLMRWGLPRPGNLHERWRTPISMAACLDLLSAEGLPVRGGIVLPYRTASTRSCSLNCRSAEQLRDRWTSYHRWTDSQVLFVCSREPIKLEQSYSI